MQVDSRDIKDTDAMIKQVEFWYDAMKKGTRCRGAQRSIQAPGCGSRSGSCPHSSGKKNYKLCMTMNITVTQHLRFAEILSKGKKNGYLVLMGDQLDDQIAKELEAKGVENAKDIAKHGAEAVIRKSYRLLAEKGYKNLSIMTAAVRGPWHIQNSFAPVGGAPVLITTVTGKINQFDAEPTPFDSLMDQPVEEKYLEVLKTSDVFNKAICTPDEGLLTWENLYEYPLFVAFFTQFVAAYQEIEEDFK